MGEGSFYPKKRWGQSFLKSKRIAERLVSYLSLKEGEVVLEIGPGKGILTEFLVRYPVKVVAVEIDKRLVALLRERFKNVKNLEIIEGDILEYTLSNERKIIGNLPYSVSSPILFYLLNNWQKWRLAVLTLQKEFADRLLAKPGNKDYGALTVISDIYTEKERLFSIPASFFKPRPDVVSTAIRLYRKEKVLFADPGFIDFIKICFAHRRKTLLNNLSSFLKDKERLIRVCGKEGIDLNLRAEELNLEDFRRVYEAIKEI